MTKDEALTMCLEYIETDKHERKYVRHAIKAALEQAEPVACRFCHDKKGCWTWQCYTCGEIDDVQKPIAPAAQRPWQGLTEDEIASTATSVNIEFDDDFSLSDQTIYYVDAASLIGFTRAIEAMLMERNHG